MSVRKEITLFCLDCDKVRGIPEYEKPRSRTLGAISASSNEEWQANYNESDYIKWLKARVLGGTSLNAWLVAVEQ